MAVLESLQKQALIEVVDAAWVTWPEGRKSPKTHQLHSTSASGALGGGFWGLLFGLIFFIPLIGLAIGAAAGALAGSLTDVGIDDGFITRVRDQVTPGTSALFAMTQNAVQDRVLQAFEGFHPELISSNLSEEQEGKLRAAFGEG